ncbi:MAG TPA: xanthine dehydrogenase family protein molybdopterin-binding subunit [Alphaproteobacteria bacterium]|nr:xanthine dehydrogenase family protein molybdopterin-binding subunit [Alphaproteobacteria bacterium]
MGQYGIGQPIRRKEDQRLLTGQGRYTDDVNLEGQAYVYFLRSTYAHAKIVSIDTADALAAPGVIAIYTSADLIADGVKPIPCEAKAKSLKGVELFKPPRHAMAHERVRYVGEPIAMVIAETLNQAKDASELIQMEMEELPAIADTARLTDADAPLVWEELGSNIALHWETQESKISEEIFKTAHKTVSLDLINNRLVANPMEPRCAVAEHDAATGKTTLYAPTQGGRRVVNMISKEILNTPLKDLRHVAVDTGGGFGVRSKCYPELVCMVWAARKQTRPLKWRGDRTETFVADAHGRDQVTKASAAFDKDGKILAVRNETIVNVGAYLSENGAILAMMGGGKIMGTAYDVPVLYFSVKSSFSNTVPTDTYRGAGRPEVNFIMERLIELGAQAFGVDVVEMRKRNFIKEFPYKTQMGCLIDSGDFPGTLDLTLEKGDYKGFEARRAEAKKRGKLLGIGIGYYVEGAGGRPFEEMRIRFEQDGTISLFAGTYSHGQGHDTVYSQLLHEFLGVDPAKVKLIQGDTDISPKGSVGTFGSRSSMMGGVAIKRGAANIVEKGKKIAGHLMQTDAAKVTFKDSVFYGANSSVTLAEVARAAYDAGKLPEGLEGPLDESYYYEREGEGNNYPNGCHLIETEIDPDTGSIKIVKFTAVDDCGTVLNPLIVDGQVLGGIAQGIGQAMTENTLYDADTAQFMTASFMDYGMPRAEHFPMIGIYFNSVPSPTNDLGVKGAGEAGACGAPPALVHAVLDALKDYGIRHIDMPVTPEKVWRAIQDAKKSGKAA